MTGERESRLAGDQTAPSESTAADTEQSSRRSPAAAICQSVLSASRDRARRALAIRRTPEPVAEQLSRRRAASQRLVSLDCGCKDSWTCRCTEPPLSEHAVDGWRDAAQHLLDRGETPVLPIEVLRSLYRRGGSDRVLAEHLHQLSDGRVA